MQILELECDPWRDQHFAEPQYINEVHIPMDDADAFSFNPDHRWVYDRHLLCRSQHLECGRHDVEPSRYPVACEPAMDLEGAGGAFHVLYDAEDFRRHSMPGTYWRCVLTGGVVSSDYAVVNAQVTWCRHASELASPGCWLVEERSRPRLEKYCGDWIAEHLAGYSGMVNIESIGGHITRVHLRFTDRWSDLYGRKWLHAVIRLYRSRTWDLQADAARADRYSVALYGAADGGRGKPDGAVLARCRSIVGISSIRLMPAAPGPAAAGSRLSGKVMFAVINAFNLEVGLHVRETLARELGLAETDTESGAAP